MPIKPIQHKLDTKSLTLAIIVAIQCGYELPETINADIQNNLGHTMQLEVVRNNNRGHTM